MSESICIQCAFQHLCPHGIKSQSENVRVTGCSCYKRQTNTNSDRIRAMSDEELARFFCDEYGCPIGRGYPDCGETPTDPVCMGCWLDWLKQEAEE